MPRRTMTATAFRKNIYRVMQALAEAREELLLTSKHGSALVSPLEPGAALSAMATLLENAGRRDWGFYTREEQRMHLQTVDGRLPKVKVWLESRGTRVFEWAEGSEGLLRAKDVADFRERVRAERDDLEDEWCALMVQKDWISASLKRGRVELVAYPGTAQAFERKIPVNELLEAMTPADVQDWIVDFNRTLGSLRFGPRTKQPKRRHDFHLGPLLFSGPA